MTLTFGAPYPTPVPTGTNTPGGTTLTAYSACLTPGCANTGPRVAVGPQPTITCAPSSVNFTSGQSSATIQTSINGHAPGTSYCFGAGTYTQPNLTPQSGDTYIGVNGAIFNGANTAPMAFSDDGSGGAVTNVTIKNITFENYNTALGLGVVDCSRTGTPGSTGWKIFNNQIEMSAAYGIRIGSAWNVVGNSIHGNNQGGWGAFGVNATITDNELYNNDPGDIIDFNVSGAGGGKAYITSGTIVSYNYSHDNIGPGIWYDTDNTGSVISFNDSENNSRNGIMYEISWDGVIQNNYLAGNGSSNATYGCSSSDEFCGAIFLGDSGAQTGNVIDISNNTIITSANGGAISFLSDNRGSGLYGPYMAQNVKIHNNNVNFNGQSFSFFGGADHDGSDPAMFTTGGNSMDYDAFTGAGANSFFVWGNSNIYGVFMNFAGFQSAGLESHGTSH